MVYLALHSLVLSIFGLFQDFASIPIQKTFKTVVSNDDNTPATVRMEEITIVGILECKKLILQKRM